MNQPVKNMVIPESDRLAKLDLVKGMSRDAQLDPNAFISTVMRQCFDVEVTKEQFLSFLMVANEYGLNPLTKEIHGFAKGGKVVPIVGIDGWLSMINKRPELDGIEYEDHRNETGGIEAITCVIYRKDRDRPTRVTEYLAECRMDTAPWKKWPTRMLRHKATIQCARTSFSFSGIYDPDEGQRIMQGESDIIGTAEVVRDEPSDAASRIVSKLAYSDAPDDFVDEPLHEEPVATKNAGDNTPTTAEVVGAETGEITDGDNDPQKPNLDEIPGIKKGSEVKAPPKKNAAISRPVQTNEEFIAALEGKGEKGEG